MSNLQRQSAGFKDSLKKPSGNDRPSPSPRPSQASKASTNTNDLKRKRIEPSQTTVFSQPADTGTGMNTNSQISYALNYLKDKQSPQKLQDIISYLSITTKHQETLIQAILERADKVVYNRAEETYAYRAHHDIRSEEALMKYLQSQPTAQGLSVKELRDGWTAAGDVIDKLEKEGKMLAIRNKKDNQAKTVWLDDPSLKFTVDDEFKAMWLQIKIPDAATVAAALQKENLVPASKVQVVKNTAKVQEKKKKKARQGGKVTNKHMMGVLKDYSHLKK